MARRKKISGKAFVLVRLGWEERYGADRSFNLVGTDDSRRTLGKPVAVFAAQEEAEARKAQLEREEREWLNPFTFVGTESYDLENVTSLKPKQLASRLKKLVPGTIPPGPDEHEEWDWNGWWTQCADTLTEEQRQLVWGLLDRLEFYRVLPIEVEG